MAGKTAKGLPTVANTDGMLGPAQLTDLAEKTDALIGESVETADDLPSNGNWPGRTVLVTTPLAVYVNDGTEWVSVLSSWVDFAFPSYSQISGFSNTYSKIRLVNDEVQIRARFTMGTSGTVGAGPSYVPPVTPASWLSDQTVIGEVLYRQGSIRALGFAVFGGGNIQLQSQVSANGQLAGISSSTPNAWATGHWFEMNVRYPIAR